MSGLSWKKVAMVALAALGVWSCSNKKNEKPNTDANELNRQAVLKHIADHIIMPGYANFSAKLDTMIASSEAFAANPTQSTLAKFRQTWLNAYVEWQKVELIDVGPTNDHTLRFYFNIYPTDTTLLEDRINQGGTNLVTSGRFILGFPALDYMLYGYGSDAQTLARYTSAEDAAQRIVMLRNNVKEMQQRFYLIYNAWKDNYKDDIFVKEAGVNAGAPFNIMINGYVLNYEKYIRTGKIATAAGVFSSGTLFPEKVEAYYKKDLSLLLAQTAHQASIDFFNGKSVLNGQEGPSLKTYLIALKRQDLVDAINAKFAAAHTELSKLKPNFAEEVANNNQAMLNTFDAMQAVVPLLKNDMANAMSVGITYVDNDGD